MKTYTVKEIADMLKTNPETVRRWIRLGKLEANQSSRKGGNVVTEQSLSKFLKTAPKYAGIAAGTIGLIGLGIPTFTIVTLSKLVTQKVLEENAISNSQITITEMIKFIETSIRNSEKTIALKKEEIKKLKLEITSEEQQIQEFKNLIEQLTVQQNQT